MHLLSGLMGSNKNSQVGLLGGREEGEDLGGRIETE